MRERYVQVLWINRYKYVQETLYLFRNPANAARLEHSLAEAEQGEFVVVEL